MNMEGSDQWSQEQWEELKHHRWELIQEVGDRYYELYESDIEDEDEEEVMRTMLWKEEEEKANKDFFRVLEEEDQEANCR